MEKELKIEDIKSFKKDYKKVKKHKLIENAVRKNGIVSVSYNSDAIKDLTNEFSIEVKDIGAITNQKQSGRCWMFAGLNTLRRILIKNLGIKDVELSESYLMFYDKLEKSNCELEYVLETLSESDDSRTLTSILEVGGHTDGGFWHFFKNLVKKYGIVPKICMDESYSSSMSYEMDDVLHVVLTKDVSILRSEYRNGKTVEELSKLKEEMLSEIYRILAISLGEPVEKFSFKYIKNETPNENKDDKKEENKEDKKDDKDSPLNKFTLIEMTPVEFYEKYVGKDLDDYVDIVNWPIRNYPMYQTFSSEYIQNVYGAKLGINLNLPIEEIKKATIESLKNNEVCWFACDVSASSSRKEGYLSTELLPVGDVFDLDLSFDKGERLLYRASSCNHAMMLGGVDLNSKNKPTKWKVVNSWGSTVGFNGIYVMSDPWFDEYVYEVVVNKKYLSKEALEALNKEPILLDVWAPVNKY